MKRKQQLLILVLSVLFMSCQSTKIYKSFEETIYTENRILSQKTKKIDEEDVDKKVFGFKNKNENLCRDYTEVKITVISDTDFKFITYSFFLKPFVILGSATYSLGKCLFISTSFFIFGVINYVPEWVSIFDYKQDKEDMINARNENAIKCYPDYHKPFTKNHIIIEKTVSKTTSYKTKDEKTVIISYQKYEYDNTIYIKKEAKADFYSTFYVVRYIGNIITIPISFTTAIVGYLLNKAIN